MDEALARAVRERAGQGPVRSPGVLEVPRVAHHGLLNELAARFGGADMLTGTVSELQKLL